MAVIEVEVNDTVPAGAASAPSSIIDYIESLSESKHDSQIEVDSEYFYKASIVRQLFDICCIKSPVEKRAQALSRFPNENKMFNLDNCIMVGDTLLHKDAIVTISQIKVAGKKEKGIAGEKLQSANIFLDVRKLDFFMQDEIFVWSGDYKGEPFSGLNFQMVD